MKMFSEKMVKIQEVFDKEGGEASAGDVAVITVLDTMAKAIMLCETQ